MAQAQLGQQLPGILGGGVLRTLPQHVRASSSTSTHTHPSQNIRNMRDERWREGSTIGITCSTCTSTTHTSTAHTPAETHTPTPRKQWRTERMRSRPERSVINPERDKERTGENHQRSQPESRRLKTFGPLGLLHWERIRIA